MTVPEHAPIPIRSSNMLWVILAREGAPDRHVPTVVLEWGWDAGLTDEELAQRAPDAPRGKGTVRTTLDMAKSLHAELGQLIAQLEQRVAANPPPLPTPIWFDLFMLYVMEECVRTGVKERFNPRDVLDNAEWHTRHEYDRVIEAAKELPGRPGETAEQWRTRLRAHLS